MQEITSIIPAPPTRCVAPVDFTINHEMPWRNNAARLQGSTERREGVDLGDGLDRPSLDRAHDNSSALARRRFVTTGWRASESVVPHQFRNGSRSTKTRV